MEYPQGNGPWSYFPSIEAKYGRSIEEWMAVIDAKRAELPAHGGLVAWLKSEHGLGHGHANALVGYALKHR